MDSIRFQLALARHHQVEKRLQQDKLDALTGGRPTTAPPTFNQKDNYATVPSFGSSTEALPTPPPTPTKSPISDLERYQKMMFNEYE